MAKKTKSEEVKVEEKKVKTPKLDYHIEISVNDVEFKTDAESLEVALTEFVKSPEFPFGAKTKLILVCSKGNIIRRRLFQTPEARRMLTTLSIKPSAVTILADQLTRSLEE